MKETVWGIIGPGKIASKFAQALKLVPGARLGAVASRDKEKGRAFAATHSDAVAMNANAAASPAAVTVYDNYAALAADPAINAIYIATPHGFHAEHALLCLRQGKAVLCEKPLALSAVEVQSMIDAAREHRAFLLEAMWTRFIPLMGAVMEMVGSGRIGTVRYIRADFGFLSPFDPAGRLYNLRLGGGSLLDIGIYPLYLCLQLLGEPDQITAAGSLSPTGSDVTCHAILQYGVGNGPATPGTGDRPATPGTGAEARSASAVISSTLTCQTALTAEIAGTEGMIRIPTPWYKNDRFEWNRTGEPSQIVQLEPMVNGFEYQIAETMRCMEQGLIESPSLPHAFSLMMSRTMDAIRAQIGVRYNNE
jgi:predicted dehydrogenase